MRRREGGGECEWSRGMRVFRYKALHLPYHPQMEIQREKDRVVELTNETKKFKALKKV